MNAATELSYTAQAAVLKTLQDQGAHHRWSAEYRQTLWANCRKAGCYGQIQVRRDGKVFSRALDERCGTWPSPDTERRHES